MRAGERERDGFKPQRYADMKIISLIMFVSLCPQRSRHQKGIISKVKGFY